ncbi:MAG TPA: SUF system NifU family Fe-S cluster assembly protein [Cyclobacteriaceae bacterium]|nr:SUF system NifU family Fe-S cluster assembly protein [Cyclobacteriaceae bacterium]
MSERISKLYPEELKAHNEHPYHFNKVDGVPSLKAYNSICGDRFELYIGVDRNVITSINFHGFGCAISKASTSVLAKMLEEKTLDEALRLCNNFLRFISNEAAPGEPAVDNEFMIFSAIHEFPERQECASLAWSEMRKFLESKSKK